MEYSISLPAPKLSTTDEVTAACSAVPLIAPFARLVGRWVWVEFPAKPHAEVLTWLKQTGFRWNKERAAWQHSCGHFTRRNRHIDPRTYYGQRALDFGADHCTREEAGPPPPQYRDRVREELNNFVSA